ncbi:hypothetical protein JCM14036_18000 [Desulfotomaculum defluvii]
MKLYHFTNLPVNKLIPKIEDVSYLPKDLRVLNKPVIWLSDLPKIQNEQIKYRYTVEVPDNDPNLSFDKGQQIAAQIFQMISANEIPVWYYLTREISVLETWEWNGTEYVKVTNFED